MGWGVGIGSFLEGYSKTMSRRHAEREQQFNNLMDMSNKWRGIADREREKTIQDANSATIIKEAELNAHKSAMDAEKAMNNKIGGLGKIGGLIKGLIGQGQGEGQGKGGQTSGGGSQSTSAASGGQSPDTSEGQPALAPPPGQEPENAPPEQDLANFQNDYGNSIQAAAPAPAGEEAPAPQISGLGKGQFINPEILAKQQFAFGQAKTEAQELGKIHTKTELDKQKQIHEQNVKLRSEEFDKMAPELEAAGYTKQQIAAGKTRYVTEISNIMGTPAKPIIDNRPYQDPVTKKWFKHVNVWDEALQQYKAGTPIETGAPSSTLNKSAAFAEKVQAYLTAHGTTDEDEAAEEVRKMEWKLLENKLKSSGFRVANDAELLALRGDRVRIQREAAEAKKMGKNMTPATAASQIAHADSMARIDIGYRLAGMTSEEAHQALLNASNLWLYSNVGMGREELQRIISSKPPQSAEDKTANAARGLLAPPASTVAKPGTAPVSKKKSGEIKPR